MKRYGYLVMAGCLALGTMAAAGCSDDDEETSTGGATGTSAATTGTSAATTGESAIVISDAWCRPSPMVAEAGACYMMIENTGDEDDALVGASVPASVAAETQIHETVMAGSGSTGTSMEEMTSTTMGGMTGTTMGGMTGTSMAGSGEMEMREVEQIELPAGETVELKPGGYHIMLMELAAPLEEGSTVEITLEFETAESQTIDAEVRAG